MTHDEIQLAVDRFAQAWGEEDLEALLACYDTHAEVISPLLHTLKGIDAIDASHQNLFHAFTGASIEIHDIVIDAEDQRAVLVLTTHATHTGEIFGFEPSGRRTATQMAFVFHFKDGRIIAERRLYDFTGFLMQIGVLKAKTKGV